MSNHCFFNPSRNGRFGPHEGEALELVASADEISRHGDVDVDVFDYCGDVGELRNCCHCGLVFFEVLEQSEDDGGAL